MALQISPACQELLELQHGVIARWQIAQAGHGARFVDPQLHNGRWQPLYRGVYATFTGQPPRIASLWAAVLRAGPGAALSYDTAAELDRLIDKPGKCIHVTIGPVRQVTLSAANAMGRHRRLSCTAALASTRRAIVPVPRPGPGSRRQPLT